MTGLPAVGIFGSAKKIIKNREKGKKRLWVVSLDAFGEIDAPVFESLPGFQKFIESGSYLPRMRSVFPSLTYPAHASIVTGRPPRDTGIVNNHKLQPEAEVPQWFWHAKDIQGDTLFLAAKRKGLKTGALLWPVSAAGPIDYNLAEIFATKKRQSQILTVLKNSTKRLALLLQKNFGHVRKGIQQPELDNFTEESAYFILDRYDPEMLFIHWVDVDAHKHAYGHDSDEVKEAIVRTGKRLERLWAYRESRSDKENIDIVLLSDHSQLSSPQGIYLNSSLEELGVLTREGERIASWEAASMQSGGSCYIYLNPALEKARRDEVKEKLRIFVDELEASQPGIERVYSQVEAGQEGADSTCLYIVDAKPGYQFSNYFRETESAKREIENHKSHHGFHPDHPHYDAIFIANGPSFQAGFRSDERGDILKIAPTLSKVMDLNLRGAMYPAMDEILR